MNGPGRVGDQHLFSGVVSFKEFKSDSYSSASRKRLETSDSVLFHLLRVRSVSELDSSIDKVLVSMDRGVLVVSVSLVDKFLGSFNRL